MTWLFQVKAECIRSSNSVEYIRELEERIRELEDRAIAGQTGLAATHATSSLLLGHASSALSNDRAQLGQHASSPAYGGTPASVESHIGPSEPLAHDVGLLSLGNMVSRCRFPSLDVMAQVETCLTLQ